MRLAVILLAPILFWVLATGLEAARRRPDAFEMPLAYLAFTWVAYLPVFGIAGVALIGGQRFVLLRSRVAPVVGAVVGAVVSIVGLSVAAAAYGLPMRAWQLCLVVGAALGATLLRIQSMADVAPIVRSGKSRPHSPT